MNPALGLFARHFLPEGTFFPYTGGETIDPNLIMSPNYPSDYALFVPYTNPNINTHTSIARDPLKPSTSNKLNKSQVHCLAGYANDPLDDTKEKLKIDLLHTANQPPTIVLTLLRD
eukprot:gene7165-14584_t